MSTASAINGVIFDMDGVLCDSEPYICDAACLMFKQRHGIDVTHDDFKPFTGTGEDRFLGGVAEKFGISLHMPDDKNETYRIYLDLITGRLQPLPGTIAFITRCIGRGISIAVASSADAIKVEGNLQQIGLPAERFDAVVCGSDAERKKPDPEIFLLAARKLGLPPSQCLVVEDAVSGVQAGKAAGARVLGVTTRFTAEELIREGADYAAPDLAHVPDEAMK